MNQPAPQFDFDLEAERRLLEAAVAEEEADERYVTHGDMRAWLLELAQANFNGFTRSVIVRWLASARHDVVSMARHIATENPLAATHMPQELLIAGDSLASFPHRGRPGLAQGIRELVAVWPYLIVYRIDPSAQIDRIIRV